MGNSLNKFRVSIKVLAEEKKINKSQHGTRTKKIL